MEGGDKLNNDPTKALKSTADKQMLEENKMRNTGVYVCMPSFILPGFFLLFILQNKLQLLMNKRSL